jgi:peptidoglycan/LPS O-acetylase OafA/YrhL
MAEKKNSDFVDALRRWAILGVIAFHVNFLQAPPVEFPRNIFVRGERGVQLFYRKHFSLFLFWS